ncbi:MAG: phospho-N-acetylmuramoyl-pentapeptide-transferase [Clostridiales bacterium]|nr:phospho-N-acetylmuramoyl-pentapeptide-transferase [Clostridiales bacterium]
MDITAAEFIQANLLPFIAAFAVTAALGPVFIPWLHKLKFGQEIREEGPKWHQKKSGTPTMGGIMFMAGIGAAVLICSVLMILKGAFSALFVKRCVLTYAIALGFGIIGFVDDYIKVVKKRNLGLTPVQKFTMQLALAVVYVLAMYLLGELHTDIFIPFVDAPLHLPIWLYVPFILFVLAGVVNAVNLTDGLDGLASSVTAAVMIFFTAASTALASPQTTTLAVAVFGAMLGFLLFNRHPAKVFMGDTGSLFLGALVALMAIDLHIEIFLIPVGFVYFAETLSVILQTSYFKYTKKKYGEGRRIFKMSPIHHHFELCGWKENKIVFVFVVVTLVLSTAAYFGLPKVM